MDVIGLWRIVEINAMDMSFKQSWRSVDDLDGVPEMQRMMAKAAFMFEEGGRLLQLLPKEMDVDGGHEAYDDAYVVGQANGWKEEGGRLMVSNMDDSEEVWTEAVQAGDMIEVYGFFRLSKA